METARLVRDFIDTLAWPVVALVLVTLFLVLFRLPIGELIRNIKRIGGPGGTSLDISPQQPLEPSGAVVAPGVSSDAIEDAATEIQKHKQSAEYYYLAWLFEKAYRVAYGTQLALLTGLGNVGAEGLELSQVQLFHTRHLSLARAVQPDYNYSFSFYVGFLSAYNLMTIDARYHITDIGRAFLNWITLEGLAYTSKAW